jgi:hypothetical protein
VGAKITNCEAPLTVGLSRKLEGDVVRRIERVVRAETAEHLVFVDLVAAREDAVVHGELPRAEIFRARGELRRDLRRVGRL